LSEVFLRSEVRIEYSIGLSDESFDHEFGRESVQAPYVKDLRIYALVLYGWVDITDSVSSELILEISEKCLLRGE
jgi:hypothetical protein